MRGEALRGLPAQLASQALWQTSPGKAEAVHRCLFFTQSGVCCVWCASSGRAHVAQLQTQEFVGTARRVLVRGFEPAIACFIPRARRIFAVYEDCRSMAIARAPKMRPKFSSICRFTRSLSTALAVPCSEHSSDLLRSAQGRGGRGCCPLFEPASGKSAFCSGTSSPSRSVQCS